MKYDSQLIELKNSLPNAKSVLIALPVGADIDKFAAGLALFLALKNSSKEVSIVSEDTIRVAQAHLFGVDNITKTMLFSLEFPSSTSITKLIPVLEQLM